MTWFIGGKIKYRSFSRHTSFSYLRLRRAEVLSCLFWLLLGDWIVYDKADKQGITLLNGCVKPFFFFSPRYNSMEFLCGFQNQNLDLHYDRWRCIVVRFVLRYTWTGNTYFSLNIIWITTNELCNLSVCELWIPWFYFVNLGDIINIGILF